METSGLVQEILDLAFGAPDGNPQRAAEHQAEHFHKAFSVNPLGSVIQGYGEGLACGDPDKLLHIPDRTKMYHKFFFIFHLVLYKPFCFVYNGTEPAKIPTLCIITNIPENAIVALDDSNKISTQKLAVITR